MRTERCSSEVEVSSSIHASIYAFILKSVTVARHQQVGMCNGCHITPTWIALFGFRRVWEQIEFHEKYYSADAMKLCVLGKESLDTLEVRSLLSCPDKDRDRDMGMDMGMVQETRDSPSDRSRHRSLPDRDSCAALTCPVLSVSVLRASCRC